MISVSKHTFCTKIFFKISHLIKRVLWGRLVHVIDFAALGSESDQQSALRLRRTVAPP